MSAPEQGKATHGRNSADVFNGPTQPLRTINDRRRTGPPPFVPRPTNSPSWVDAITRQLPTIPRPSTERTELPSPGELMDAALDGAKTFQRFLAAPSDRNLASRLTPKENPTLSDRMFVWGANSVRLAVTPSDLMAIAEKLANHPELIPGFDRAFKEGTIEEALPYLPWDLIRQIS